MISKTITYKSFDDAEFTEKFYFSLTKEEITELEISEKEGYGEILKRIAASKDNKEIYAAFKSILLKAYCEKSPNHNRPVKSKEISDSFKYSEAYSTLVFDLIESEDSGASFIRGIMPADMNQPEPKAGLTSEEAMARSRAALQDHRPKETTIPAQAPTVDPQIEKDRQELADLRAEKARRAEIQRFDNEARGFGEGSPSAPPYDR